MSDLNQTTGNILFSPWEWPDIINYTDHIMHTTYSHLSIYLIGVLIADLTSRQSVSMSRRSQFLLFFAGNGISLIVSALLPRYFRSPVVGLVNCLRDDWSLVDCSLHPDQEAGTDRNDRLHRLLPGNQRVTHQQAIPEIDIPCC